MNLSRRFTAAELAVAKDLFAVQQQVVRQPSFPTSRIRLPGDVAEGASLLLSNTNVDELRATAPHLAELVELIENSGRALASEVSEYRLAIEGQLPHIHFDS